MANRERDIAIIKRNEIYDEICLELSDYEMFTETCPLRNMPRSDCELIVKSFYELLCKIQRNWEDVITASYD